MTEQVSERVSGESEGANRRACSSVLLDRFLIILNHSALHSGPNDAGIDSLSTGPLTRPFARSLALLTHLLTPDCSLRSRPLLRSLVRSLAHFAHSLACGEMIDYLAILSVFFSIFDHSALREVRGQFARTHPLSDLRQTCFVIEL